MTSRRLYLETMEQVLKGVNKVIIDGKEGSNGVVPYLPLPELERRAREPRPEAAGAARRRAGSSAMNPRCSVFAVGGVARRAVPAAQRRCSPSTRPSRRWSCSSAIRSAIVQEPGLHLKVPFVQQVDYFEKRVLDFDAPSVELVLGDQKRLVVDAFARYRITDALRFRQSVGTEAAFRGRLEPIVFSSLRSVLGEAPLFTILSQDRTQLMNRIKGEANKSLAGFGVELVDVRIKRADLPPENSQAVFRRMQTEREREAKELRAQGAEVGQRIRARADRERRVLIAEAQRESEILRGQGDAEAIRIFAEGFGQNPEFFDFYRSLQAYREALGDGSTSFVLSPDSEFFRFFNGRAVSAPVGARGSRRRSRRRRRLPRPRWPHPDQRRWRPSRDGGPRHGAGPRPGGRGCALGAVPGPDEAGGGPSRADRPGLASPGRAGLRRSRRPPGLADPQLSARRRPG